MIKKKRLKAFIISLIVIILLYTIFLIYNINLCYNLSNVEMNKRSPGGGVFKALFVIPPSGNGSEGDVVVGGGGGGGEGDVGAGGGGEGGGSRRVVGGNRNITLIITSEPSDAKVYLDKLYKGLTPLEIQNVSYGTYDLLVIKDGYYDHNEKIIIDSSVKEEKIINVVLKKIIKVEIPRPISKCLIYLQLLEFGLLFLIFVLFMLIYIYHRIKKLKKK